MTKRVRTKHHFGRPSLERSASWSYHFGLKSHRLEVEKKEEESRRIHGIRDFSHHGIASPFFSYNFPNIPNTPSAKGEQESYKKGQGKGEESWQRRIRPGPCRTFSQVCVIL